MLDLIFDYEQYLMQNPEALTEFRGWVAITVIIVVAMMFLMHEAHKIDMEYAEKQRNR